MKEMCVDFISSSIVIRQFSNWLWTATAGNAMRVGVVFHKLLSSSSSSSSSSGQRTVTSLFLAALERQGGIR